MRRSTAPSGRANGIAAITPERVIREGDPTDQILDVIDKDVDISMLVLAANPGPEGPGPIITMMAQVDRIVPDSGRHRARRSHRRGYRRAVVTTRRFRLANCWVRAP